MPGSSSGLFAKSHAWFVVGGAFTTVVLEKPRTRSASMVGTWSAKSTSPPSSAAMRVDVSAIQLKSTMVTPWMSPAR